VPLGLLAITQAFAIAWVTYDRSAAPVPHPGGHLWWHSAGPAHPDPFRAGVFLCLAVVALYLLLPLSLSAARTLRRLAALRGAAGPDSFGAQAAWVAASTAVAVVVTAPVAAAATALAPAGGGADAFAVGADTVAALRFCLPIAALTVLCSGVPWRAPRPEEPNIEKRA
jgi:hypothetical protein